MKLMGKRWIHPVFQYSKRKESDREMQYFQSFINHNLFLHPWLALNAIEAHSVSSMEVW